MSAAISRSDPMPPDSPARSRMHGRASVRLTRKGGQTMLADLHQSSPMRVLFPLPADGDPLTVALVATSGGLVGGDSLAISCTVDEGASGLFVRQAAEKIYRSLGEDGRIDVDLSVGPAGWLEYLPQETILFDEARLRRRTRADVATGGRLLAGEMLVFGRRARGEIMTRGLVRDAWEIRRAGQLVWADALRLDGDIAALIDAPAGLGGCHAMATMVLMVDDPASFIPILRATAESPDIYFGASVVNSILHARWLSDDAMALRQVFGLAWGEIRSAAMRLPKTLPRLWHI